MNRDTKKSNYKHGRGEKTYCFPRNIWKGQKSFDCCIFNHFGMGREKQHLCGGRNGHHLLWTETELHKRVIATQHQTVMQQRWPQADFKSIHPLCSPELFDPQNTDQEFYTRGLSIIHTWLRPGCIVMVTTGAPCHWEGPQNILHEEVTKDLNEAILTHVDIRWWNPHASCTFPGPLWTMQHHLIWCHIEGGATTSKKVINQ